MPAAARLKKHFILTIQRPSFSFLSPFPFPPVYNGLFFFLLFCRFFAVPHVSALSDWDNNNEKNKTRKKYEQVLLRWSAEQGIPFVASSSSASSSVSSSVSEVAAAPSWALSPASRDGLDGAAAAAGSAAELRTLVPKAGAGFAWPVAAEGGAGKASEALLLQKQ